MRVCVRTEGDLRSIISLQSKGVCLRKWNRNVVLHGPTWTVPPSHLSPAKRPRLQFVSGLPGSAYKGSWPRPEVQGVADPGPVPVDWSFGGARAIPSWSAALPRGSDGLCPLQASP